jgi:putative phage-type endonuclease
MPTRIDYFHDAARPTRTFSVPSDTAEQYRPGDELTIDGERWQVEEIRVERPSLPPFDERDQSLRLCSPTAWITVRQMPRTLTLAEAIQAVGGPGEVSFFAGGGVAPRGDNQFGMYIDGDDTMEALRQVMAGSSNVIVPLGEPPQLLTMPQPVAYPVQPEPRCALTQMDEAEFLEVVATRTIGGSQLGMILGLSEYGGPADVWDSIMGLRGRQSDNPDMERGRWLEPIVAEVYALETGRTLQEIPPRQPHPTFPFLHWSPDRLIAAAPFDCISRHGHRVSRLEGCDGPGTLEIKCPRQRGHTRVRTEGISPSYYVQLQFYMDAAGHDWGSFAVFNAEAWDLIWFDTRRDDDCVDNLLVECDRFWHDHELTRIRPGSDRPRAPLVQVPPRVGAEGVARNDPAWAALVREMREAREVYTAASNRKDEAEEAIKAAMEEMGADVVVGGGARITWRESTRRNFDRAALEQAHPELDLSPFFNQSVTRTFRPTFDD